MQDKTPATTDAEEKHGSIDNYEQYLLHGHATIIHKLRQLAKGKNMITAHFGGGKHSMLTFVVDVMPDRDLLVLDYGSNETINEKLLNARRIVFKTRHQGITAQFTATEIQRAKLQGKTAFACPIPDSLLWVQRREFYRVHIPRQNSLSVEISTEENKVIQYTAIDISIGGISLLDCDNEIAFECGQELINCKLNFFNGESGLVNLSVRNILPYKADNPAAGNRIGCAFMELGIDISSSVQRYIHSIDAHLRRIQE